MGPVCRKRQGTTHIGAVPPASSVHIQEFTTGDVLEREGLPKSRNKIFREWKGLQCDRPNSWPSDVPAAAAANFAANFAATTDFMWLRHRRSFAIGKQERRKRGKCKGESGIIMQADKRKKGRACGNGSMQGWSSQRYLPHLTR